MKDFKTLTAEQILGFKHPESLFDEFDLKGQIRRLRRIWHSDLNGHPKAKDVMQKIHELYIVAENKVKDGNWGDHVSIKFDAKDGRSYQFNFLIKKDIDIGTMYVGRKRVIFNIRSDYDDLCMNATHFLERILAQEKSASIYKEISKYVPTYETLLELENGSSVLLVGKDKETYLLEDLLEHVGGKIHPKQVAWMVSSMLNLASYFHVRKIVHNEISEHTFFVNPAKHYGQLIGGWFYAAKEGSRLVALPSYIKDIYPSDSLKLLKPDHRIDSLSIKRTAIKLLGDPSGSGSSLLMDDSIPKPILNWLRQPSSGNMLEDYKQWYNHVLVQSYGKHKFVKFDKEYSSMYTNH